MLTSKKIEMRRSEIRQSLAELAANDNPSEDETRKMADLDKEYRSAETRYRAAIISEDEERREAGEELETRSDREWSELMPGFEMRQVLLALDEGRNLDGQTAEIVSEMRSSGGYQGVPVPFEALEIRVGETVAADTPAPVRQRPVIERLFANTVAARMGGQMVNIGTGATDFPVATSEVSAGWAATELGDVPGPTEYQTIDRPLKPDHTLGARMKLSRKSLKQSGPGLEQAVRRDMTGAIGIELDRATFLGTGANGEPLGIIPGAAAYGFQVVPVDTQASWSVFRAQTIAFMNANTMDGPGGARLLFRPEIWDGLDGAFVPGTAVTEYDRARSALGGIHMTTNALSAPTGTPATSTAIMTTSAGGTPPYFVGTWGGVDMIRDVYSDAASGQLRITGLLTADVTVSRSVQTRILTGLE